MVCEWEWVCYEASPVPEHLNFILTHKGNLNEKERTGNPMSMSFLRLSANEGVLSCGRGERGTVL